MTKQPMTPSGVADLMTELYQLSATALQAEAVSVQADFKAWINANFILNTTQEDYLDNLNGQTSSYFGSQCSICFTNKLPITLINPGPPTTDYSKWTGSSNSLTVQTGDGEIPVATGSLTFEFIYRT